MDNEPHRALTEVLQAEAARVRRNTALIVDDFRKRWGDGIFADDLKLIASNPTKPLVLAVDWIPDKIMLIEWSLKNSGCIISPASQGRIMLAKIYILKPRLIVTGLNILLFYPPAYFWTLANAYSADGIPMLFVTAAGEWRYPLQIPRSPRVRIQGYGIGDKPLSDNVREMLGWGPAT